MQESELRQQLQALQVSSAAQQQASLRQHEQERAASAAQVSKLSQQVILQCKLSGLSCSTEQRCLQASEMRQAHEQEARSLAARFQEVLTHRDGLLRECQAKLAASQADLGHTQAALEQQQAAMAALC